MFGFHQVIAVACEDGTCSLWLWSQPQAVCVENLQLPPGKPWYLAQAFLAVTNILAG